MQFLHDESGQDLTEYALLLAFVAMAAVALLLTSTDAMRGIWVKTDSKLNAANSVAAS